MSTVHTRYVTWISRGRRHHGSAMQDLTNPLSTAVIPPGPYQAWASPSISWNDAQGQPQSAQFAFWSVTGAADGAQVSFDPSLSVQVGASDVQATAWYLPGGDGRGEPGLLIDAFDVQIGNFVDDDFVTVSPDSDLSPAANEEGFVPNKATEHVQAFTSIHGVPLDQWKVLAEHPAGTHPIAGADLQADAASTGVAFAFYKTPGRPVIGRPDVPALGTWVSWGVMVDGGGPTGNGPVDPWGPLVRQLAVALAMADAAQLAGPEMRKAGLDLAARQMEHAAKDVAQAMRKVGGSAKG